MKLNLSFFKYIKKFYKIPPIKLLLNIILTLVFLSFATCISSYFYIHKSGHPYRYNIPLIYTLCIMMTAYFTADYFCGFIASLIGTICILYFFTYPDFQLDFSLEGYPATLIGMLFVALITSTAATHMRQQAHIVEERNKFLLEAEKENTKANLLRAITHDFRTPLTGIIGSSSSYLENEELLNDNEKRTLMQNINEDAIWLLRMSENILSITRMNSTGTEILHTSEELVEEVLSESITRFKKRIPDKQIIIHVPEEPLLVPMDAVLIEQVIINLLHNAVSHGKSPLPIECYVTNNESEVIFHIKDYGIGLSEERLQNIFNISASPNMKRTIDVRTGMGIGLSICKSIITAHGGQISAKNLTKGSGCEFCFSLPKGDNNET